MSLSPSRLRILTGLVLAALLGAALGLGGLYLFAFILVFTLAGQWEFYALFWCGREALSARLVGLVLGGGVLTAAACAPAALLPALGSAMVLVCTGFLLAWARNPEKNFGDAGIIASGLLYGPVMLAPVLGFTLVEQLFLLCVTASSDTAAYFCGMRFGRHKIWPAVSPNKSVEGSLAGLAACVALCTGIGLIWGSASPAHFALLALGLGLLAQFGDFFESALKRSRRVKDSSSLLPGHGGVLDRIDSLLFVVPTYAAVRAFWTFF